MVGNSPVPTMDELPFKIVKMLGARDEVIARREFVDLPRRRHGISHHWIAGASRSERECKRRIASGSRCNSATGLQNFFGV